jgi:hypothetical protein
MSHKVALSGLLCLLVAIGMVFIPATAYGADRTFHTTTYDGDIVAWGSTYALAHDQHDLSTASFEDSDNVTTYWNSQNYLRTELQESMFRVGQEVNAGGVYGIWRGLLTFDTSSLPKNITVTAATLYMMPQNVASTGDNFTVEIRSPGDMHYPAIPSDFDTIGLTALQDSGGVLYYSTHPSGTLVVDTWEAFAFTATGLDMFTSRIGNVMQFAVMSSNDRLDIAPDFAGAFDYEFIDFFTGDSQFAPYIEVTYTVNAIGEPDYLGLRSVGIFTDYQQTGDQLFLFTTMIEYDPLDVQDKLTEEYFYARLLNGANLKAQMPCLRWGYGFTAIYLNAASAIPSGDTNYIRLTGVDGMFLSPTEPTFDYTILAKDWKGSSALIDKWVLSEMGMIGEKEGGGYYKYLTDDADRTVLSPFGEEMVLDAVPGMNSIRPDIFLFGAGEDDDAVYTPGANDMVVKWGAYWGGAFNDIGTSIGLTGAWVAGILCMGLAGLAMYLVRDKTNEPTLAIIAALPVMAIGFLFAFNLVVMVITIIVAAVIFWYTIWLKST